MPIVPPVSRDRLLEAFGKAFILPENMVQERSRPRASSLAACARQQAYAMAGTKDDPIGVEGSRIRLDSALTSEQGRMFEEAMVKAFEKCGVNIEGRQVSLPESYPVSGHPDGEIRFNGGMDLFGSSLLSDETLRLRWGVEFKHLGRYGYLKTIKNGIRKAHPNYILQAALYGDALGWDAVMFVVSSQDASSISGEATASLRYKNEQARWAERIDWHPKLHVEAMELTEVQGLLPIAKARARWLSQWKAADGVPKYVAREYDPELAAFPCNYCPYLEKCRADGSGGNQAPELPFRMD